MSHRRQRTNLNGIRNFEGQMMIRTICWLAIFAQLPLLSRADENRGAPRFPVGAVVVRNESDEIVSLSLEDQNLTVELLHQLGSIPTLKCLNLSGSSLDDSLARAVADIDSLESLNIGRTKISDAGIATLSRLPHLATLKLDGCNVTDASIPSLARFKSLTSLDVASTPITPTRIPAIQSLSELLLQDRPLDDEGMKAIASMPNLRSFRIRASEFGASGLLALARSGRLTSLSIYGGLDQHAVESLAAFPQLEQLTLRVDKAVPQSSYAFLSKLSKLKRLDLATTTIDDEGLRSLQGCRELTELDLSYTKVSDAGLASLSRLKALRRVRLRATDITSVAAFSEMNLEFMDIRDTKVSAIEMIINKGHRQIEVRR